MSRPTTEQADDQLERLADLVAERLAPRLADLLRDESRAAQPDDALVGPDEIARRCARSVEWVRDHADELGVIRLGDGPKARLWFRADVVDERLRSKAEPNRNADEAPQPRPSQRSRSTPSGAHLLEIKDNNGKRAA